MTFQLGICVTNNSSEKLVSLFEGKIWNYIYELINQTKMYLSMVCANDHPTPLDFKYKKHWYVLEKHFTSVFTRNPNTTDNNEEECVKNNFT
ncbi:hypothetical protein PR048_021771 [Dryococelus australis]|uniref:Uncharacterized protein n=1 Tax=Dryococelus australis TaxID=614101 RepID=A0ABQ9GZ86_9NEOP|nr:hypothetical protein PR048_021771 [Dryococelus australis]